MTTFKVGYFVGSLANGFDQPQARQGARAPRAAGAAACTEIPFRDLPLYSYDYDADYPPVAHGAKDAIAASTPCCS